MEISVVIITRNEAHIIGSTLKSLRGLTDDIVIVDSGSTDDTLNICRGFNAKIIETGWNGYGPNKNIGINAARHNWILNLDADEAIDEELKTAISKLSDPPANELYEMWFKNYFMNKWIRHGEWGSDKHIRLFNRTVVRWNEAAVHEQLMMSEKTTKQILPGYILHHTVHSLAEYEQKTIAYARLNAKKYAEQGKKWQWLRQQFSPVFSFIHNYLVRLGFLDGREGYLIARTTARYTYLKYAFLHELLTAAEKTRTT